MMLDLLDGQKTPLIIPFYSNGIGMYVSDGQGGLTSVPGISFAVRGAGNVRVSLVALPVNVDAANGYVFEVKERVLTSEETSGGLFADSAVVTPQMTLIYDSGTGQTLAQHGEAGDAVFIPGEYRLTANAVSSVDYAGSFRLKLQPL